MKSHFVILVAVALAAGPVFSDTTSGSEDEAVTETTEELVPMVLDAELVEKGKKVFKKCKACHKIGDKAKNGVGPILNGIYGRAAAEVADYSYSDAMTAASAEGLIWDEESLRQYLKKPKDMIPKTKMAFAGLRKDKDLDAIMEFLKSISQEP